MLRIQQAIGLICLFAVTGITVCLAQEKTDQKLKPEQLIAKHLASIGSEEARARVTGMKIKGTCYLSVRQGGTGQVEGLTTMASQGNMNLINMTFDAPGYPYELLRFDGKTFSASQVRPGVRTSLGQFFVRSEALFKEGLVGGTLSSAWALLQLQQTNPKLEYAGLKKTGERQLHALKYKSRHAPEMKITLFFDAETFQHVRTEYEETIYTTDQQRIGPAGGLPTARVPRSSNTRIKAFEEFSEFKQEGGLNLPHTYKFELSIQSEVRPALVDWVFTLTDFTFNPPLDTAEFQQK